MIAVDAWKPADGLTLEPNALRAAKEQVRSLALTAGPGAGKTEMLAQRADFLLHTGDLIYPNGDAADYQRNFFEPYRKLLHRVVFMPSLGNHDVATKRGQPYLDVFELCKESEMEEFERTISDLEYMWYLHTV